jgi:hypothetical protein
VTDDSVPPPSVMRSWEQVGGRGGRGGGGCSGGGDVGGAIRHMLDVESSQSITYSIFRSVPMYGAPPAVEPSYAVISSTY